MLKAEQSLLRIILFSFEHSLACVRGCIAIMAFSCGPWPSHYHCFHKTNSQNCINLQTLTKHHQFPDTGKNELMKQWNE